MKHICQANLPRLFSPMRREFNGFLLDERTRNRLMTPSPVSWHSSKFKLTREADSSSAIRVKYGIRLLKFRQGNG